MKTEVARFEHERIEGFKKSLEDHETERVDIGAGGISAAVAEEASQCRS